MKKFLDFHSRKPNAFCLFNRKEKDFEDTWCSIYEIQEIRMHYYSKFQNETNIHHKETKSGTIDDFKVEFKFENKYCCLSFHQDGNLVLLANSFKKRRE